MRLLLAVTGCRTDFALGVGLFLGKLSSFQLGQDLLLEAPGNFGDTYVIDSTELWGRPCSKCNCHAVQINFTHAHFSASDLSGTFLTESTMLMMSR